MTNFLLAKCNRLLKELAISKQVSSMRKKKSKKIIQGLRFLNDNTDCDKWTKHSSNNTYAICKARVPSTLARSYLVMYLVVMRFEGSTKPGWISVMTSIFSSPWNTQWYIHRVTDVYLCESWNLQSILPKTTKSWHCFLLSMHKIQLASLWIHHRFVLNPCVYDNKTKN